jgi:hypothetical protein
MIYGFVWGKIFAEPRSAPKCETFEKCSIMFKVKSKIPDFERGKARILTTGIPFSISRIRI